jgi:hypothetical protein
VAREQAGERSQLERHSGHTVAAQPPDFTQKALDTPIASFQSVLLEIPCPSLEVTGSVPTVPFPAVSNSKVDSLTSRVSLERILQEIPETLWQVIPTTIPATTSERRCSESPRVLSLSTMTSQQIMPSPIYSTSTEAQVSILDHSSSQITSSGPHSPTPLSKSIAQANDPAPFAELLTANEQIIPPEDDFGQPWMPITESVIRSNDCSAPCTPRIPVDSPASPRLLQQSPKPRTLSKVSPVPEALHTSSEENGAAATHLLSPTPISKPQGHDHAVSGSAWLWRGGAAAELSGYQPTSTAETSKAGASTSRQPTPFTGEQPRESRRRSIPLIMDTNDGIPIVIYDTDEEIEEEIKEEIKEETKERTKEETKEEIDEKIEEAKTDVTALYETLGLRGPKESRKRNLRKRVRDQGAMDDQWVRPQHERKLWSWLRSAFYKHEYTWMCVRELPQAIGVAMIEAHDEFVQDFGQVCRANKVVSVEDTRTLRTSFSAVSDHLLPMVHRGEDKEPIEEVGTLVDEIHDHAFTLASIYAFRAGGDDSDDDTYSPFKKRRF